MFKKDTLLYERKSCYDLWDSKKIKSAYTFAETYKQFLQKGKTERTCLEEGVKMLEKAGFVPFEKIKNTKKKAGQKIYFAYRHKALAAFILGKEPITQGMNMILTHIDSPRLDIKVNPLYEDKNFAYLKTQYYGGIKKYQWPIIPLALYGVVILKNGKKITMSIGDKKDDPVFIITDLLPHAASKQMEKRASEFIDGETLNIIVGSVPVSDKKAKERVKQAVLELLHKEYGMIEEDFQSAELEAIPVFEPKDIGLDRSLIGAYGHDDSSCSYTALQSLLHVKGVPERTTCLFWSDKEEVGSYGSTGAQSDFLSHAVAKIVQLTIPQANDYTLRDVFHASYALSGDVDVALDSHYQEVHDIRNTAVMNHGVTLVKYTGGRGKYGGNDADAEYMGRIRKLFNDNNIVWQTGNLSKVDAGGGGTIAIYLAALGIQIIDCGPCVLSMHSPFEVLSKVDLYAMYEAYKTFYEKMR